MQAVIRDESSVDINRELIKVLPNARFSINEGSDGREGKFTVTVHHARASASAEGFR